MLPCYSYLRFSNPSQALGDSTRRQTTQAGEWVEKHPGYYLDTSLTLHDKGLSAFSGEHRKRGALGVFLKAIEANKIPRGAVLYIESLDRLSRQDAVKEALPMFQSILQAGVKIATRKRLFDWDNLDVWDLMEALIEMKRAHEESAHKSYRLKERQAEKRANINKRKITATCPSWLKLSEDKTKFEPIPERVQTVKEIFRLAIDGLGAQQITSRFNSTGVPIISFKPKAKAWSKSYVLRILSNRAVLGEFQPHTGHVGPDRKPIGEVVKDYFPRIISDKTFYRAQQALQGRKIATGPQSTRVSNLFTGWCYDAMDGATMVVARKSEKKGGHAFVSSAAQSGRSGSKYVSFPYELFERGVLNHIKELKASDISGKTSEADKIQGDLDAATAKLAEKTALIAKVQKRLESAPDTEALLDTLVKIDAEVKSLKRQIEAYKRDLRRVESDALSDTKQILKLLESATGDELYDLRVRLKQQLRNLISEAWVLIDVDKSGRYAHVDLHYVAGGIRTITVSHQKQEMYGNTVAGGDWDWGSERRERGIDLKTYRFQ